MNEDLPNQDWENRAAIEARMNELWTEMIQYLSTMYGFGNVADLGGHRREDLESELEIVLKNWLEAECADPRMEPKTEIQHLLAEYHDLELLQCFDEDNTRLASDWTDAVVTSFQLRAARALLGLTATELAERAHVHHSAVDRLEQCPGRLRHNVRSRDAVLDALRARGIEFVSEDDRVGVILNKANGARDGNG